MFKFIEQLSQTLLYASHFSILIPFISFFTGKQDFKNPVLRGLIILLSVSALFDLAAYILEIQGSSNIIVGNSYTLIEFFLLSYLYYLTLANKKLVYGAVLLFVVFFGINTAFIQPFTSYQGWTLTAQGVIMCFFSVTFFLFDKNYGGHFHPLMTDISLAVLFYFSIDLYVFPVSDFLFKDKSPEMGMLSWSAHNAVNILKNIIFAVAIFRWGKENQKPKPVPAHWEKEKEFL